MKQKIINPRHRLFIASYNGNATEAAKLAGYSEKTARSQGQRLLTNVDIAAAIKAKEEKTLARVEKKAEQELVSREKLLEFCGNIIKVAAEAGLDADFAPEKVKAALKAADLAAKIQGLHKDTNINVNVFTLVDVLAKIENNGASTSDR